MEFLPGVSGVIRAVAVTEVAEANRRYGSRQHDCHPRKRSRYTSVDQSPRDKIHSDFPCGIIEGHTFYCSYFWISRTLTGQNIVQLHIK